MAQEAELVQNVNHQSKLEVMAGLPEELTPLLYSDEPCWSRAAAVLEVLNQKGLPATTVAMIPLATGSESLADLSIGHVGVKVGDSLIYPPVALDDEIIFKVEPEAETGIIQVCCNGIAYGIVPITEDPTVLTKAALCLHQTALLNHSLEQQEVDFSEAKTALVASRSVLLPLLEADSGLSQPFKTLLLDRHSLAEIKMADRLVRADKVDTTLFRDAVCDPYIFADQALRLTGEAISAFKEDYAHLQAYDSAFHLYGITYLVQFVVTYSALLQDLLRSHSSYFTRLLLSLSQIRDRTQDYAGKFSDDNETLHKLWSAAWKSLNLLDNYCDILRRASRDFQIPSGRETATSSSSQTWEFDRLTLSKIPLHNDDLNRLYQEYCQAFDAVGLASVRNRPGQIPGNWQELVERQAETKKAYEQARQAIYDRYVMPGSELRGLGFEPLAEYSQKTNFTTNQGRKQFLSLGFQLCNLLDARARRGPQMLDDSLIPRCCVKTSDNGDVALAIQEEGLTQTSWQGLNDIQRHKLVNDILIGKPSQGVPGFLNSFSVFSGASINDPVLEKMGLEAGIRQFVKTEISGCFAWLARLFKNTLDNLDLYQPSDGTPVAGPNTLSAVVDFTRDPGNISGIAQRLGVSVREAEQMLTALLPS